MTLSFSIAAWSGWMQSSADSPAFHPASLTRSPKPDVSAIPALLRRRLSLVGRACASELLRQLPAGGNLPIVYGARHGDAERTLDVLKTLSRDEPVSPMSFSLSVHNAICGILSIHSGITANITALAASDEVLIPVLLEAAGLLSSATPEVLCLVADAPLPAAYGPQPAPVEAAYAACIRLTLNQGTALSLTCVDEETKEDGAPQAVALLQFLDTADSNALDLRHNGMHWQLHKQGAAA